MAYLVLDDCLGLLFSKDIDYSTSIVAADGGEEDRNANWTAARRTWRLEAGRLTDDLVETLEMHFHMTRGAWKTFLLKDRLDFDHWQVSTDTSAIQIAAGDGSETDFPIVKLYGSGADQRSRTITNPISGTVTIWLEGILQTEGSEYTIDYDTGIVTFASPPGPSRPITATFQFRVRVRFASDKLPLVPLAKGRKYLTSAVEVMEVRR